MCLEEFIEKYKGLLKDSTSWGGFSFPKPRKRRHKMAWKEGADELMKALRIDIEFLEENRDKIVEIITRDDK
ncbi:MAG: hypothetical protein CBC62_06660 [Opitutia bacterium TMED102]|nr:hypothetical protein [Verrucomicrobiales bacterium]OUV38270.1 MAG: hypothetical protein CBC62_06660 [Opitutae bacterium TMED102]